MKRLLLFILLACSAPLFAGDCAIEIIGADMPMCDGAVQVGRKKAAPVADAPAYSRDGLIVEFLPQNYSFNTGGTAEWLNTGSLGGAASQTVETEKPVADPDNKRVRFLGTEKGTQVCHWLKYAIGSNITGSYTIIVAGAMKNTAASEGHSKWLFKDGVRYYNLATGSELLISTANSFVWHAHSANNNVMATIASGSYEGMVVGYANTTPLRFYKNGAFHYEGSSTAGTFNGPNITFGTAESADFANWRFLFSSRSHINGFFMWNRSMSDSEMAVTQNAITAYFGAENIGREP